MIATLLLLALDKPPKIPDALFPPLPAGIKTYQIRDERLDESSGVAPSHLRPGVYYTHNDSGDKARFFAFKLGVDKLEEFDVTNAQNVDWEDIAIAKLGARAYVYCGDIGDNAEDRKSIHIYRVPEPVPVPEGKVKNVTADLDLQLTYPDGPHNAETLLVDPQTGDITIVIKQKKTMSSGVYYLPAPNRTGSYQLLKIGDVVISSIIPNARLITGGAIAPDRKHVVLRTYLQAYEFDAPSNFTSWYKSKPRPVAIGHDPQGEGISYSLDLKNFITTSEGSPCQISVIPRH